MPSPPKRAATAAASPRDPAARAVLDALRRLVRALRLTAHEAERRAGVSAAQLFVLQSLVRGPAPSLQELGARTLTDPSSVSVVVARLVARGLLARRRDDGDRRRLELRLTPRGRALLRRVPADAAQQRMLLGLARLSAGERRELGRLLERWTRAMGLRGATAGMFFEEDARALARRGRE